MPRQAVWLTVVASVVVFSSLAGGRSLVANVDSDSQHVVKAGETLSGISRSRGVSVDRVLELNGLTDPNALAAGQVLQLPPPAARVAPAPPAPPQAQTPPARPAGTEYAVKPGDTLSGIALAFGLTYRALAEANQLADPDRLTVGQRLLIPEGATRAGPSGPPAAPGAGAAPGAAPGAPLADRVLAAARAAAGPHARIGVAGHDLVGGQRLAIAADQHFPAASVAKLAILAEAYRQNESGKRPLTAAIKADLHRMIAASDNAAANRLLKLLGLDSVNTAMTGLGLARTQLTNYFAVAPRNAGVLNRTSPADMVRFLDMLAADRLVSPAASREMRNQLALNQDGSKLRRGLPPGARLAHKSGWFDGVANDVGIVHHGGSAYVLAVFTEGIPSAERANQTVAAVARAVHEAWGPK
jgi:beta-lactamase class A